MPKENNNNSIYLFSSSIRYLYKLDVYNVLSYPDGFVMHFRYRKKWVNNKVWNSNNLEGKEVLVIALVFLENELEFFPIRRAKLIRTEKDGDVLHVYFELLAEWVDYRNGNNDYDAQIKEMEDRPKIVQQRLEGDFISFGYNDEINFSAKSEAWKSIVEKIGNKGPFKNGIFYRFTRIYEAQSENNIAVNKFDKLTRGFILKGGKRYVIDFSFNFGKEPPENAENVLFKIEAEDLLRFLSKETKLGFIVDKKKFNILPQKTLSDVFTNIVTKIEDGIEGPNLEIPIEIEKGKLIYVYGLMILIGLIFVSGIIPKLTTFFQFAGSILATLGTWLLTEYNR